MDDEGFITGIKQNIYLILLKKIFKTKIGRERLVKSFDKKVHDAIMSNKKFPEKVQLMKYNFLSSMLQCVLRNANKGYVSGEVADRIVDTLVRHGIISKRKKRAVALKFKRKHGIYPPSFIVLSPTQSCNLKCIGCYASSTVNAPTLPFDVVDKIVSECSNEFGHHFLTISGGEPLMYRDKGKSLFDIWEKYNDMFFLFYTNGMMITKQVAEKLAKLGNVTPAISVEGFAKETDQRRGKGTYKKILRAMRNLRKVGVPFGVSVTATGKNIDILLETKFYDYFFKKQGVSYMWMFHLMPIGKAKDTKELMITPKQRVKLYKKVKEMLFEKKYCIADFWNSGALSDGCIAYGRAGGYFYIDWNGNITPCVFVPYYEDNVFDLYSKGKTLTDALKSKLFVNGRKWQEDYGLDCSKKLGNWLMPCSIRDHYKNFKHKILTAKSKPEDVCAEQAVESKEYENVLVDFDEELEDLTEPIWEKEFLKG